MSSPVNSEQNLQTLAQLYPDTVARLEHFLRVQRESNALPQYRIDTAVSGALLCWKETNEGRQWVHGPSDPVQQVKENLRNVPFKQSHDRQIIVVWRCGLGYAVREIMIQHPKTWIILCENRLELLWEALCRWDIQDWMLGDRRLLVADDDLKTALLRLREEYPSLMGNAALLTGCVLTDQEVEEFESVKQAFASPAPPAAKAGSKTFFLMSRSPSEVFPALMRCAKQLGYGGFHRPRSAPLERFLRGTNAWRETCGGTPEIALGFYGSFFNREELGEMGKSGVKRVCWYYDTPNVTEAGLGALYDLALVFDRSHLATLTPHVGDRAKYLPAATAFDGFTPRRPEAILPQTPVSYIGATGYRLSLPYLEQNRQLAPQLLQVVNRVVAGCMGEHIRVLQQRLLHETVQWNPNNDPMFKWLLLQLAASRTRVLFLHAAQPFGLTVYGDALWQKREYGGNIGASYAGRSVSYETETPEIYAATKINLNIFHPQVVEGVPIRVYDVLACGGFLLTEYRPVLEEQFTIGKDFDVFRTPQELSEKIAFYLDNDDLRRETAEHGRWTVLEKHTYKHRLADMLKMLKVS